MKVCGNLRFLDLQRLAGGTSLGNTQKEHKREPLLLSYKHLKRLQFAASKLSR